MNPEFPPQNNDDVVDLTGKDLEEPTDVDTLQEIVEGELMPESPDDRLEEDDTLEGEVVEK